MTFRVKINLEAGSKRCERLREYVPTLEARFPGISFEVVTSRVPEVERYPKVLVIWVGEHAEWIMATLYGFRSEEGLTNFLASVLEEEFVCEVNNASRL